MHGKKVMFTIEILLLAVPANFLEPFSHQNVSVGEKAIIECSGKEFFLS